MPDYDVVVVGAGNGGLTSALSLAAKGLDVLLLERHNVPGGCATSFVRGRFEFEVALHQLSGMGGPERPGPLRDLLNRLGVMDKVEFVEEDTLYRAVLPGLLDVTIPADRNGAAAALKDRFPGEAGAVDRFLELVWEFCNQWVATFVLRDPEASKARYPVYFTYALKTAAEVLDAHFKDPLLKLALAEYWGYMGLPPSRLPFADLAILIWVYIEFKPYHMKGGSQALSNALLDSFLEKGGRVRFNCAARKIRVAGNRVQGVVTEDGDEISADYVMSNASSLLTYVELVGPENAPPQELANLGTGTVGPSAFTVYLGLDREPKDLGLEVSTTFITDDADMDRHYALWRTLDPPGTTGVTCYDVADPEFSPPGACQVVVISLQYAEPWLTVPPARYAETKYRYAEYLLDRAERVYPGLRNHIEECEVATPLTHLRYLGHPGGAIYGFDQYAKDSNLFWERTSAIKGLYFAGAWVGSGGFQPTLESGVLAARAILRDMGR
ncbi:MAG: NAD(P)/FAD-dependent oxidoreductase [Proteobacteria bacterium]|nr:NAD(P)/FAD-dependent oxidoreductase [Pseudomonadota bacterium]